MIHPDTELRFVSPAVGYGVFATKLIPKGTITWILDEIDQHLEESYVCSRDANMREKLIKYCYRDRIGRYVLCWDIGRFVNHSFNANCISTAYEFELAVRDIEPGEELTDDYGYLNLDEPFYCFHEQGSDRTKVMPDDLLHFYPEWDRQISEAMRYFSKVEQPLKSLIDRKFIDKVNAAIEGKEQMESILSCYYDRSRKFKAVGANGRSPLLRATAIIADI